MPRHTCVYCNKIYSRTSYYKRHVLLCEMVHTSRQNQEVNIEENNHLYSYNDLINIVQELKYEFVKMQDEFQKIKSASTFKTSRTKKKEEKVEIIEQKETPTEWLNKNRDLIDLEKWVDELEFNDEYLKLFDEYGLYESLHKFLGHKIKIPIYKINNNFYTLISNNTTEILSDEIEKYINKIISKIWNTFIEWQKTNINKMKVDEYFQKSYHLRLQNICNKNNKNKYLLKIKEEIIEKIQI